MSKSAKALLLVGLAIVVLVAIRVGIGIVRPPNDAKLISDALADAIKAGREGRPGGVVELFSNSLSVNGTNVSENQRTLTDFIRKQRPDMIVQNPTPKITGSEARIISPVELDLGLLGKKEVNEVTLIFKKEDATEFLIVPTSKWRLTEVRVPDSTIQALSGGL